MTLITRENQPLRLAAIWNVGFFSVPPTQPEGGGMLTSSFEIIRLNRIIYISIYEVNKLAMSCIHGRNLQICL